jgi:hypothetical protein
VWSSLLFLARARGMVLRDRGPLVFAALITIATLPKNTGCQAGCDGILTVP